MHTVISGRFRLHFNPDLSGDAILTGECPVTGGKNARRVEFPGALVDLASYNKDERIAELEGALREIVCIALDDVAPRARLLAAIGDRAVAMVGRGHEAIGG